ncbi:MAG: DEAD/DEAH box helicase family protein [Candidatus Acidiferrales bacterium]
MESIQRISVDKLASTIHEVAPTGNVIGVRLSFPDDEGGDAPWLWNPSRKLKDERIMGPLPAEVCLVVSNLVYIEKKDLPSTMLDRLIRIAAFQNPEFYKAQAMRLSTYGKPRIISCAETFPEHLGLPRGCLDDVFRVFKAHHIKTTVHDERAKGRRIQVSLYVELRPEQQEAVKHLASADVAVIQSLHTKGSVEEFVTDYGHVIVDECHHLSAVTFERVLREVKAKYILGLTATPTRKDGHHPIIHMQCGPVRFHLSAKRAAETSPLEYRVVPRFTDFASDNGKNETTIQDIYAALVTSQHRNELILQDLREILSAGRSPLVLTSRTEHLDYLASRTRVMCPQVFVMKGGMGVKQRRTLSESLATVRNNEPRVILATGSYLGEGFDDARLDTLLLAMPISWRGTLQQYVGRLHRLHEGKKEVQVYDYADVLVPMLGRMYKKRLAGYAAFGYTVANDLPT